MEKCELKVGDMLQINPEGVHKGRFGGMVIVCTEPKSFGCQGYLLSSRDFDAVKFNGRAFLRVAWEEMEYVGRMEWLEYEKEEVNSE